MTPAARLAAAAEILDQVIEGTPAEKALTGWARRSRFAGSKDRAAIRDHVFDALRCRRSFAALGQGAAPESGRGLMLGLLRAAGQAPEAMFTGEGHAPKPLSEAEQGPFALPEDAARDLDLPGWVWPLMQQTLGDQARAAAEALRHRAPVHIRVNTARTSVAALQALLEAEGLKVAPVPLVETALEVTGGARRLQQLQAFEDGLFEMQDAASQAICAAIPLAPGARVLDYCAGGGGKTLALGARGGLDLTAHDAAPARMKDLPARAARAGLSVQLASTSELSRLGPFDLVLCDAPCSGSGAWRRAPEGKWLLTPERLDEVRAIQAQILDQARDLVAPGGQLAYATCSLFAAENGDQADAFLARHGADWSEEARLSLTPADGGDGFFLARFRRRAA
ncbi:RsmB/NOP family class I SAM-dependent RNA methyltransferase [Pseudooceanicola sp. CBS1P-1]|uniref:RsmB/NOP family class I SAM-dependent RNA methyltransferase n=1 Tax=Pseudooceanicola albus TaxID=2692189 RepID=A0A6L7FWN2_9RHOB|nr:MULTISPECIES: RsmB/NOP family class I SAM-dependent RNA methyltransferase [Pseudooceanicola]MBT9383397.1 RsmB/NOP family class I SAM-dependent RNA methyltransferase [Pseudooceanicola endophyticus]MXN16281.1 RsmB/NOP family class I SAM-dependent RNA methyltransferase [Pseudooceanicola albus]